MRVAILDDIHHAYEGTIGVRRLRERAEVLIFTEPFEEPSAIANFDALIANRERTRFSRALLEQLPNLRIQRLAIWSADGRAAEVLRRTRPSRRPQSPCWREF
jgi:hypothetical protein